MVASYIDRQPESRVPGSPMARVSQSDTSTRQSEHCLDEVEGPGHPLGEGERDYAIVEDDGIGPDDAPELVWDDSDEGVWNIIVYDALHDLTQVNGDSRARPLPSTCLGHLASHKPLSM